MAKRMETLAQEFDAPVTSPEHRRMADGAWLGGELVKVRYYLGRLTKRNLFREPDAKVERRLKAWLADRTSKDGAAIASRVEAWQVSATVLRFEFEQQEHLPETQNRREVAAILAYLTDPTISDTDLARRVDTTEKQLARMSTLSDARILGVRFLASRAGKTR